LRGNFLQRTGQQFARVIAVGEMPAQNKGGRYETSSANSILRRACCSLRVNCSLFERTPDWLRHFATAILSFVAGVEKFS
jgi:hypothetical protein